MGYFDMEWLDRVVDISALISCYIIFQRKSTPHEIGTSLMFSYEEKPTQDR